MEELSSKEQIIPLTNLYCRDNSNFSTNTFLVLDSSYDRAVEEDRRGSVPNVTLQRPSFSLSPSDETSDKASISSSYSESKVRTAAE